MDLWIPVTIFAAFCQNARSALQRHLAGRLGTTGATFVRFGYGVPFALVYLAGLHWLGGHSLPEPNAPTGHHPVAQRTRFPRRSSVTACRTYSGLIESSVGEQV